MGGDLPHRTTFLTERRQFNLHAVHAIDAIDKEDQYEYKCYLDI